MVPIECTKGVKWGDTFWAICFYYPYLFMSNRHFQMPFSTIVLLLFSSFQYTLITNDLYNRINVEMVRNLV